ncbi:MAG: tRNA lysidine(34) synthetase TilS [Acidobacteriota bacterium]
MNKFVRNLITEWRKLGLPISGETVLIGVSGGADSSALLAAMAELRDCKKLKLTLIAAHLNHGLRGDAAYADRDFVEKLSGECGVEFVEATARIQKRGNLEQNARDARYDFFRQAAAASESKLVLTGHTMNDQAETFLLNLMRGSGPDGLAAIRPVRCLEKEAEGVTMNDGVRVARPLLRWVKREDTVEFCEGKSIEFRLDAMNEDTAFTRVRVRKTLIPLLRDFNPKIIDTLCTTAERIREMRPATPENGLPQALPIGDLAILPTGEMFRVIRSWLAFKRGDLRSIEAKHIEAIQRLILSRKSGKTVELPNRQTVSKQGGRLVFESNMVEK